MSQHDYNIANAPGATVRADINALAEAIASQNAGNSAPSVTFAFMLWADTTNGLLKIRNPANSGWITIASISGSTFLLDDTVVPPPVSGDWFGTLNRVPRLDTSGVMEVGGSIDFHPDAAGTEDYRLRLNRATGANGAATITQTGSGGLNIVPGAGGFKVNGVELVGHYIGEVIEWSGSSLPAKCVWANGQNLSRTTYAAYFAIVSTTYGNGDGSTTFGVLDKRGRVGAGKDDMGGSAANRLTGLSGGVAGTVLGAAGGSQSHVLTKAQMPLHGHSYAVNRNDGSTTTTNGRFALRNSNTTVVPEYTGSPGTEYDELIGGTGGDAAHNNVQPTIIQNYVIYVGV